MPMFGRNSVQPEELNPEVVNRIIVPSDCVQPLHDGSGKGQGQVALKLPWCDTVLRMPASEFKELPAETFGDKFAGSHVAFCVGRGADVISRGYNMKYSQTRPLEFPDISVQEMENKFTEMSLRDLVSEESLETMHKQGQFDLRSAGWCQDSYDCVSKTVALGGLPRVGFDFDVSGKSDELTQRMNQKADLDAMFNQRKKDFLYGLPEISGAEHNMNRIIVPVSYVNGSPTSEKCSLSLPGSNLTLELSADQFRHIPEEQFGKSFAEGHLALCLPADVKEIPAVYRSDYDQTKAGKIKGLDVDYLSDKFSEVCTAELIGKSATRDLYIGGAFNTQPVKSCKDSYTLLARTIETGVSPVKEVQDKIRDAYKNMRYMSPVGHATEMTDRGGKAVNVDSGPKAGCGPVSSAGDGSRRRDTRDLDAAMGDIAGMNPDDKNPKGPDYC